MPTPIVDCHTHTSFSDGEASFSDNVRAAAAAGCRVLVSTDHLTLPASMEPVAEAQVPEARLAEHRAAFDAACELAREIAPGLELVYGFECDWYPGCEENVGRWSAGAVVRLGSTHWIGDVGDVTAGATGAPGAENVEPAGKPGTGNGWIDDSSDMHVWEALGTTGVWRAYVDAWCAACESPLSFDSMAHPDLPMRFSQAGWPPPAHVEAFWDEMTACARDTGRRVELSTAALRKGLPDYYPAGGLFERFCAAGVPITVGSDAHTARAICWGIRDAYAHAYKAGYRFVDAPHADGSWERLEL